LADHKTWPLDPLCYTGSTFPGSEEIVRDGFCLKQGLNLPAEFGNPTAGLIQKSAPLRCVLDLERRMKDLVRLAGIRGHNGAILHPRVRGCQSQFHLAERGLSSNRSPLVHNLAASRGELALRVS